MARWIRPVEEAQRKVERRRALEAPVKDRWGDLVAIVGLTLGVIALGFTIAMVFVFLQQNMEGKRGDYGRKDSPSRSENSANRP